MTDIMERLEAFASVWPTAYDSDRQNIALLREAAAEIGRLRGEVNPWQHAVDQQRVIAQLGVAADGVSLEEATKQLGELIDWHIDVATDPQVNGGYALVKQATAPAMPNGVEASREQFNAWMKTRGVISSWHVQQDMWNAWTASRAADNRDAAGVDRPAPGDCSHYFPMDPRVCVRCGWDFRTGEPPTPAAVPAGEAVAVCNCGVLCQDLGHGNCRYAPQPADGGAVAPFGYAADVDPGDFDMSHTMYLLRPGEQPPAGCTPLYTTPPAPVQAAPQAAQVQGEAVAYLEVGPGGYLDLGTDRSDDSLLSMPPGKYMLGIIGHPSGDAVGAALRFLGELETVGNARAGEVARGLRKVVANPSACELGADGVGLIAAERQRQISAEGWTPEHDDEHGVGELATAAACYAAPDLCRSEDEAPTKPRVAILAHWPWALSWWKPGDRIRELVKAGALIAAEIDRLQRAALQHRGDSQEVGRG